MHPRRTEINYEIRDLLKTQWQIILTQIGNVELERDSNDNKKMVKVKNKKQRKIDGPISVLNAIVAYLDPENKEEDEISEDEMKNCSQWVTTAVR